MSSAAAASGFSTKRFQADHLGCIALGRAVKLQIAIAGFGPVRGDAEGHKLAVAGGGNAGLDRRHKGRRIGHHMVGRSHQHQRLWVLFFQPQGRGQDRGGGVAPFRFDQDGTGINAHFGHLFR